jgi:Streptomyces sporulation and cell division protein, SsgA
MPEITRVLTANVINDITVLFRYTDLDPWAVALEFNLDMTWRLSRDLLHAGVLCGAGLGDVRVSPAGEYVDITLSSPDGTATVRFDAAALWDALQASIRLIPLGLETFDFDAELALLARPTGGQHD